MYLLYPLCQCGLMGIYFKLWVTIQIQFLNFIAQIVLVWATRSVPSCSNALWHIPISFWFCFILLITSLLSCIIRGSRLILYICCPSSEVSCFFKELCFLFLENGIRNKNMALGLCTLRYTFCILLFLQQPCKAPSPVCRWAIFVALHKLPQLA